MTREEDCESALWMKVGGIHSLNEFEFPDGSGNERLEYEQLGQETVGMTEPPVLSASWLPESGLFSSMTSAKMRPSVVSGTFHVLRFY